MHKNAVINRHQVSWQPGSTGLLATGARVRKESHQQLEFSEHLNQRTKLKGQKWEEIKNQFKSLHTDCCIIVIRCTCCEKHVTSQGQLAWSLPKIHSENFIVSALKTPNKYCTSQSIFLKKQKEASKCMRIPEPCPCSLKSHRLPLYGHYPGSKNILQLCILQIKVSGGVGVT